MKAVVFHGVGDIRLDEVAEPKLEGPDDALVRITVSAICGTDLHMVRGTMPGMEPGTILGHEGIGIVEEVGPAVTNFRPGDRVVVPSTIGCGSCNYCRAGYTAQCDEANPNGRRAGTSFYGGPQMTGAFDGLQAEYARVPYAATNLVRLPDEVGDDDAILISDIYPTGYFGADLAEIREGDIVAVWGCGPVGLFAVISAFQLGATRVFAIDGHRDRLERAQSLGAEIIDFNRENPVEVLVDRTGGIGPDRAIDAVGVDSERPKRGPAAEATAEKVEAFRRQVAEIAPEAKPDGELWRPGDAPLLAATWAIQSLAKAGTLSIIGVYPPSVEVFPLGLAMNKNLTLNMGNCNHRKYVPRLVEMVEAGVVRPDRVLSHREPLDDVIEAYRQFDLRKPGWIKVELKAAA